MRSNQTGITVERTVEGHFKFWGAVSEVDFARLRLDAYDRAILDEARTPVDLLGALELVFRRMAEQGIAAPSIPTNDQIVPTGVPTGGVVDV